MGNARLRGAIKSLDAESNFDGVRKKEYKIAENANGLKSSGTSDSSNVGAKSAGAKDRRARRAAALVALRHFHCMYQKRYLSVGAECNALPVGHLLPGPC